MTIKPPIGLAPRRISDKFRAIDIIGAITRYTDAGLKYPQEWVKELSDINRAKPKPATED